MQPEAPTAQQPADSKAQLEPPYVEGEAPTAAPGWQLPMSYALGGGGAVADAKATGVQLQPLPAEVADGGAAAPPVRGSSAPSQATASQQSAAAPVALV